MGEIIKILNIFFILSIFAVVSTSFAQSKTYTLGIIPQYDVVTLHKEWLPIVTHLEKALGIKLSLKLYNNYGDFLADLYSGSLDFSYMNPGHMIQARKAAKLEPLIASSDEKLIGLIVVPVNSKIKTLADLKNKTIAFPSPTAFVGSMLIQAHLREVAKVPIKAIYPGGHDNAYRAVLYGKASAAGGLTKSFAKQPIEVRQKLRIIFTAPTVISHPLAAGKEVSTDLKNRVAKELISYSLTDEGAKILAAAGLSKPMAVTYEKDYKILEELHLEKFLKP